MTDRRLAREAAHRAADEMVCEAGMTSEELDLILDAYDAALDTLPDPEENTP